jgi:hypothetical protein
MKIMECRICSHILELDDDQRCSHCARYQAELAYALARAGSARYQTENLARDNMSAAQQAALVGPQQQQAALGVLAGDGAGGFGFG